MDRNLPFGFVADVDQHVRRCNSHDHSLDDAAGFDRTQALLEHSFEIISASGRGAFFFITLNHIPRLRSFFNFEDSLLISCNTFSATLSGDSPDESSATAS